jgi:hypothetical protein
MSQILDELIRLTNELTPAWAQYRGKVKVRFSDVLPDDTPVVALAITDDWRIDADKDQIGWVLVNPRVFGHIEDAGLLEPSGFMGMSLDEFAAMTWHYAQEQFKARALASPQPAQDPKET